MGKKTWLLLAALAAFFVTGFHLGQTFPAKVLAQTVQEYHIGRDWGAVKGAMGNRLLIFEDTAGTIRIVDPVDVHPATKMLKIERILTRK